MSTFAPVTYWFPDVLSSGAICAVTKDGTTGAIFGDGNATAQAYRLAEGGTITKGAPFVYGTDESPNDSLRSLVWVHQGTVLVGIYDAYESGDKYVRTYLVGEDLAITQVASQQMSPDDIAQWQSTQHLIFPRVDQGDVMFWSSDLRYVATTHIAPDGSMDPLVATDNGAIDPAPLFGMVEVPALPISDSEYVVLGYRPDQCAYLNVATGEMVYPLTMPTPDAPDVTSVFGPDNDYAWPGSDGRTPIIHYFNDGSGTPATEWKAGWLRWADGEITVEELGRTGDIVPDPYFVNLSVVLADDTLVYEVRDNVDRDTYLLRDPWGDQERFDLDEVVWDAALGEDIPPMRLVRAPGNGWGVLFVGNTGTQPVGLRVFVSVADPASHNNAHHGTKVLRYTAGPVPEVPDTLTPVTVTAANQARDLIAWSGEDWYVIEQEVSNGAALGLHAAETSNDRLGFFGLNNVFNYNSNFVQPGYVPLRTKSTVDGKYKLTVFAVGPTPGDAAHAGLSVASEIDMPYPTFTSGQQFQRAFAVPYHGGKVFVFTANGSGVGELWSSNISTSGVASAFTKVGNLTVPVGFLSSVGPPAGNSPANYLLESLSDMAQISDRLFWSYNTKTLWDMQNPLALKDGGVLIPADASIYKPYDWSDPTWGSSSAALLNPGHLLMARHDTPTTHLKIVDVQFAADGSSCSIVNTWEVTESCSPYAMTWAKHGDGVEAVFVGSFSSDSTQPFHLYRDLFGAPTDMTPPGPNGNPSDWSGLTGLAPTQDDGWLGVGTYAGSYYVFRQDFLQPVEMPVNSLFVKGPGVEGQGDFQKHQGVFAIDQTSKTVSAQAQVASPAQPIWVQAYAHFGQVDGNGNFQGLGADPVGASLQVPEGTDWTTFDLYSVARSRATHWQLELRMFADSAMSTPLPEGAQVHFDCFYAPDNGRSLVEWEQDYLDGDQPLGTWEGTPRDSSSVYGAKPPSALSQVILLDDDLLLGDPPPPPPEPDPIP